MTRTTHGSTPSPPYAITVYSPDVMMSGLASPLDDFIHQQTGLERVDREYRTHNAAAITDFYSLTGSTKGAHWPLVVDFFDGRSVCVSRWQGHRPLEALQAIKGTAQPATAKASTIRANFWCDNPVANLVHVSDSYALVQAEERILADLDTAEPWAPVPTADTEPTWRHCRHNAMATFLRTLDRWCGILGEQVPPLPANGSAHETARVLFRVLDRCVATYPALRIVIDAFLQGQRSTIDRFIGRQPVSDWDALIIRCGLHAMPAWRHRMNNRELVTA